MTVLDDLVHQFPCFLQELLVDRLTSGVVVQRGGQGTLQPVEQHLEGRLSAREVMVIGH